MNTLRIVLGLLLVTCSLQLANGQVFINEGSNKNYSQISDEDGEFPDWIELYNAGPDKVHLLGYTLSDAPDNPKKWTFPNVYLLPGAYKTVFCSGKDRTPITGFIDVFTETNYNPVVGWNKHVLSTPFYWDGASSLLINMCSYSSVGYTTNSVFNQSKTADYSTIYAAQDGSSYICEAAYGSRVAIRPNLKLNNVTIGDGTLQNSPFDYPAPYGNWYWAARNQMLIPAAELIAAGLTPGNIDSLALDVVSTDPNTKYDYINGSMRLVDHNAVGARFEAVDPNGYLHANFKIATSGETIYLYAPDQQLLGSLDVNCGQPDISVGLFPDTYTNIAFFLDATPSETNNLAQPFYSYLLPPEISVPSGLYNASFFVTLSNPNGAGSTLRYTLSGDDPDENSAIYSGSPIQIFYSAVLKAKVFAATELSSKAAVASYLLGVSHVTPILSVVTDNQNLFGPTGIFDNWQFDWERAAYVEYFDTTQQLIFSQFAGIQIDGGAGGSRAQPQHSFRVGLNDPVLGEGPINFPLIPNRPTRTKFSNLYLRNGSNYYLSLPYKDAAHVQGMGAETQNYYSAWRPITVYVNGVYFGLYELREKFDSEYFEESENADPDSIDILSLSYWKGSVLRSVVGSVDSFFNDYNAFNNLNPADTSFWENADQYFDMLYYNDYIIAETWAGNVDWPQNNIKIYRSNATDFRWRFCLIDLEGSMNPFGFSTAHDNHIGYVLGSDPNNPYINIFLKSILNPRFRTYFINRYADLMNTTYQYSRLSNIVNTMFNQTAIEMQKEYLRWGDPNNISGQMNFFVNNNQVFLSELSIRTGLVRSHIQEKFALNAQVDVTLDVFPEGAGKIKISTIIPPALPWTGVYFDGNPVEITAIPNPGYEFAYWDVNAVLSSIDTNMSIVLNINASTLFKAVFINTGVSGKIAISEVNYNSDSTLNPGNWIEFHNYGNGPLDMSEWRFTDSTISNNYIFPLGTILEPEAYLVLACDTALFHAQFPLVNAYGPTGFGFSNGSEALALFDQNNFPVLQMRYYDVFPWPVAADGYGRTLELLNDTLNPALYSSWFAGCVGGSPGRAFVPCPASIVFSEINYQSALTADAGDWVELWNVSGLPVDISGWSFSDSDNNHHFNIPLNTLLPESGRIVLVSDTTLFKGRFPLVSNFTGPLGFGLSNSGEAIRLFDSTGRLYQSVVYEQSSPWPQGANGNGFTLELVDEKGNLCNGNNWQDGCPEGSPGMEYKVPCISSAIHSLNTGSDDLIIFPNPSTGVVNIQVLNSSSLKPIVLTEVFNFIGDKIYSGDFKYPGDGIRIDLSGYSKGIYLIRIWMDDKAVDKIIVLN
jgi:CotH kinase protein/Lamin Tail Domain/Secretion system C-terminal sorting domain/Chitobiase/beta-hexosaminidase C-terminal domain/Divergent InlB B-repeat domain